jgi:hypothetical protein
MRKRERERERECVCVCVLVGSKDEGLQHNVIDLETETKEQKTYVFLAASFSFHECGTLMVLKQDSTKWIHSGKGHHSPVVHAFTLQ